MFKGRRGVMAYTIIILTGLGLNIGFALVARDWHAVCGWSVALMFCAGSLKP